MAVEVRRARPQEWAQARDLRLEMLANSPKAFIDTIATVERWDDDRWRTRLLSHLAPDSTTIGAVDVGGHWVGQACGRVFGNYEPPRAYLLSVYVTPRHRGTGLVKRLVDEVSGWARGMGHDALWLDVHQDATAARAAYRRLGFTETGVTTPYANDESERELEMVLRQLP